MMLCVKKDALTIRSTRPSFAARGNFELGTELHRRAGELCVRFMKEKIIHIKYCRITSDVSEYSFVYKNIPYLMRFESSKFEKGLGVSLNNNSSAFDHTDIELWLTLFFGEDFLNPFSEIDTRFNFVRGNFDFKIKEFDQFLKVIEDLPRKSYPIWKKKLFENAYVYYSAGVRTGFNLMPLNIGLFTMSLECIGNIVYGKRDKHFTLGNKHFVKLMNNRLKRYKQNDNYKNQVKAFEKFIKADIELLNQLRNSFYGHSLLHLSKDRKLLTDNLKKWYIRTSHDKKFTELSFKSNRIEKDVIRESPSLYKVGLRTSRLFLFMLLGLTRCIPFASHDFKTVGDMKETEKSEYKGIKMEFKIKVEKPNKTLNADG